MKNEFLKKLDQDENLLFYEVSNINKTSKQVCRALFISIVLFGFWFLFIIFLKKAEILNFEIIMIFITLIILSIALIYGLIYNTCLKYKNKNNEYFVTNKRIAIYNLKTGFEIRRIADIKHIGIVREKNNYADIVFNFSAESLIEQIKSKISFEGIQNPQKIVQSIIEINENIHVYDGKPTIMGRKT